MSEARPITKTSLTRAGLWLVISAAAIVLVGLHTSQFLLLTLGGTGLIGVLAGLWTARLSAHALVHGGCQVAFSAETQRWRGARGVRISRRFTLSGGALARLRNIQLEPGFSGPIEGACEFAADGWHVHATASRLGSAWLQGLFVMGDVSLGLVAVRAWCPVALAMEIVPRRYAISARSFEGGRAQPSTARDRARSSIRPGFGLELRELRDHQPGDPFKHIAWSATARRGRLVSRAFEAHARRSVWLVMDASPSMFWGPVGQAPIDLAMDTCFQVADALVAGGDRVGLLVHDERVRVEIPPASGRAHLHRLVEGIIEAPHLVHAENTEMTPREILNATADWFVAQHDVELRLPPSLASKGWVADIGPDEARVVAAARRWLGARRARGGWRPVIPEHAYAPSEGEATLRAFCRHAGVPLSRRHISPPGGQTHGIEDAIRAVNRTRGGPYQLVLISDLATMQHVEGLRRAARGSKRHHHRIVVVCPTHGRKGAPRGDEPVVDDLEQTLARVDALAGEQALAAIEAFLRPAGVGILRVGPGGGVGDVLRGLARVA